MTRLDFMSAQRIRRLVRALYREELRAGAYRAYRRRTRVVAVKTMLTTFLAAQQRMIDLLAQQLVELGAARPGARGPVRRLMAGLGSFLATLTSLRGDLPALRRIRSEETRGAERCGREAEWEGWSEAARDLFDGHRCDQLYQNQWAQDVERDLARGGSGAVPRPT